MSVTFSKSLDGPVPSRRPRIARGRSGWLAVLFGLFLTSLSTPAQASSLRIAFANDFLTTNRLDDELYTGGLTLAFDKGPYRVALGENIFTDSENDVRFDESYLTVERGLPTRGKWQPAVEVGVMHVGEGLLGESAQNAFHDLIGDDRVDIPYIASSHVHAVLGLRAYRPLPYLQRYSLTVHGEAYSAIDFKQHVAAGLWMRLPETRFATFSAGLGARYSSTSFAALKPRIESFAPTMEAEVRFRNNMALSWTYNEFGTKAEHFTIIYDFRTKQRVAADSRGWDPRRR